MNESTDCNVREGSFYFPEIQFASATHCPMKIFSGRVSGAMPAVSNLLARFRLITYSFRMTVKEKVLRSVSELPDDASIEDAMERIFFLGKVEKGLQQAAAGQTLPHADVKERMAKWLK